ncbi:hypothetical protein MAH1_26360 [Sessilibacter sp. MAH1]
MTDYAAVLELINTVGEEHPQLPFMLKALGVDEPEHLLNKLKQPKSDSLGDALSVGIVSISGELTQYDPPPIAEKPLWSFPIVVVESYELHDATNRETQNKPPEDIKPLSGIKISTDELIAFDNDNRSSLWPKQTVKNGLHQFLEHVQNHQQLDIPKLAVQMAQKKPLNELPFLQTHKLPAEFWLYIDKTQGAHCFHDDYLALYYSLQTHVGPLGIAQTVELLEAKPNHFGGNHHHCHWRQSAKFDQYYEYNTETNPLPVPETGSCVIICAPKTALTADALTTKKNSVWLTFAEQLKQQRVTVLFVPLDFSQANTNPASFNNKNNQLKKHLKEQEEFMWAVLSLIPHRISLALIRAIRLQFTNLEPEFEQTVINDSNINWWHSQQCGHWYKNTETYHQKITTIFEAFTSKNSTYSSTQDLFNDVFNCIKNHIPPQLTSFIIEFKVLTLLHASFLLLPSHKQSLESEVSTYYQQAMQSIKQATENHSSANIIDETQFWLGQALRLNLPELPLEIIPKELRETVTSAKHHFQQSTQQDIPEIPVLDDDCYRELNKEKLNKHNPGVLVLSQVQSSTHSENQTDNSNTLVELELLTQEQLNFQKHRGQHDYNKKVIENLQSAELFSTTPTINSTKQFLLKQGATLTLKTLKETLTLKAYNSNDFYWAKSIQQTPQGVKVTAEQFEIHWRNPNPPDVLWLQNLFEVIVYDNAPQWLHDFPPQLDNYGIFSEITVENIPFKMRYIPPGSFLMGSPEDEPERNEKNEEFRETQHPVKLTHGFWLAETTVTQALWRAVGNNPSDFNPKNNDKVKNNTEAELPVDSVSWDDCKAFFNKLEQHVPGLQLTFPTEAQWEYACRAGTQTPFNTGNNLTTHQANYDGSYPYNNNPKGNSLEKTLPVVSFQPNAWGLYQMHGNLWEWCLDEIREYPKQVENVLENPLGPKSGSGAALRGGGWLFYAWSCRSASRNAGVRGRRYNRFGVRPCSTIDQ